MTHGKETHAKRGRKRAKERGGGEEENGGGGGGGGGAERDTLYTPPVEVRANQKAGNLQRGTAADAPTPMNDTTQLRGKRTER